MKYFKYTLLIAAGLGSLGMLAMFYSAAPKWARYAFLACWNIWIVQQLWRELKDD